MQGQSWPGRGLEWALHRTIEGLEFRVGSLGLYIGLYKGYRRIIWGFIWGLKRNHIGMYTGIIEGSSRDYIGFSRGYRGILWG